MAQLIVRNLENALKEKLRAQAMRHGRSMEEETRIILQLALNGEQAAAPPRKLGSWIAAQAALIGVTNEDVDHLEKLIEEGRNQGYEPFSFDAAEP